MSTVTTTQKTDPGAVFFALVAVSYLLYVGISASMKVITDKLQGLQADLQEGVKIQGYMQNTFTTKTGSGNAEMVELGGPNQDNGADARVKEILDYLNSFGVNPGITPPADRKIAMSKANEISNSLNSHVDLTRQSAQTESTKAQSVQTSANATLDLATSMLKTLTNALLSIAQNTPR